ncbi:hypothetical protein R5W24_005014, partial [Gemmata sp. JC717]|uniref:hypothetical protein n=1 Tax=Gemmata algarum TaxID=2975278 RepID=UPI0021BB0DF0
TNSITVRAGAQYALLTFAARTRGISHVFASSRGVWAQFHTVLQASGGLVAIFDGTIDIGKQAYPVLPDGASSVEFDYRDFILEERSHYWHLDVDRYARAVLAAKSDFSRRLPN